MAYYIFRIIAVIFLATAANTLTLCGDDGLSANNLKLTENSTGGSLQNTLLIPCPSDQFRCVDDNSCIPVSNVCDGKKDCQSGSDEKDCTSCSGDAFHCSQDTNGKCILSKYRCDGGWDCVSGQDEKDCELTFKKWAFNKNNKVCAKKRIFHCTEDAKCVPPVFRCDDVKDCASGQDEMDCKWWDISLSRRCIDSKFRCDGDDNDCDSGEDERDCWTCYGDTFHCSEDFRCINAEYKCNGNNYCTSGQDERNCTQNADENSVEDSPGEYFRTCSSHQFQCTARRSCIPAFEQCDGTKDCSSGSDEKNCCFFCSTF